MRTALAAAGMVCQLAWSTAAVAAPASNAPPATGSSTLTLSQAWRVAMQHDPTYHAAISEREAGQANRAIGRAGLLPQVSASLGRNKIRGTLEAPGACGPSCTDLDYMSRTNEIRATQTVFNWSRIAEYRQGHARADYSLAVFETKAKDTSVRLVNRYFQALLSYENVVLAKGKLRASEKQVAAAQRRLEGGEGTLPDVRESASRRDLARADVIQAEDALIVARRELQEMLGYTPVELTALKPGFKPQPLAPATEEDWLALALANNAEIRSGQENLRVADQEIDRTFGGHLPTLDLVAARRKVDAETISTRDQSSLTTSIGIQVALPIYTGGRVSAQVRQARHNRDRAVQELAATRERVAVEVTRQFQAVVTGAQRIDALELAVESSAAALKATEMGYRLGSRSVIDVLDAEEQIYRARLDLTQARLQYALARLTLAGVIGRLDAAVIESVDSTYFGPERVVLR
ncbi:MAG TPA: TolC family outer membrane protein [Burkholderiaceae bacterium]|nr:TolC family outer membrane protein [Burkholderiaceae bacterium]